MITSNNLKEVLDDLSQEEICTAYKTNKDYIKLELYQTNSGGWSTLECVDYDEEDENEVSSHGNLFTDKESFSQLVKDSGTTNKALIEYFT